MKRVIMHSELKPEKVQEYIDLHAAPWEELLDLISGCHIQNYSISMIGTHVYTYYEYTGSDYGADMTAMDNSPVMQKWWTYSKPCFLQHEEAHYYDELREVFYMP